MKTPDPPTETTSPFFKRDGLYYTSIEHLHGAEPLEIALHGITSDEQAHAAVQALLSNAHERGPKC